MRKKTKESVIPDALPIDPAEAYVTWTDANLEDKRDALKKASASLEEFGLVDKTSAGFGYRRGNDYSNVLPDISGRPGLTREAYDYFRPEESIPSQIKIIFKKADQIYTRVGLVKNVIDLMGDFASQGIRLTHPNKRIEKFYKHWFEKINGEERSERFLNNLYKIGNVIVNRQTAKISIKVAENLYRTVSSPDLIINKDELNIEKREIPWRYTFVDPSCVDIVGGALSSFVGDKKYAITLPATLRKIINSPKNDSEKIIISQLPQAILEAAKSKKPYLLDPEKTLVFHYKKDDWQSWAYPMIYSIMDDINIIEKLKLADLAALDGAISNIRIFKLGSLDHKIAPTAAAASKLSSILQNNVGGGTMDLVWGPDIELIESKTSVHQFLGEAKYTPHLNSIYAGLGIPPTLTGTFGSAGTTNNFISLKTLTQRLQYGRKILSHFWNNEIAIVQKAMGFKYAAKIEFDRMDLSNEEAEKALLVQLADRNLISDEMLQRMFGFDPDTEKNRLNRENRERKSKRMINKAGPYIDGNHENSLKKMSLQLGLASPSQVGLELEPKKKGDMNALEMKAKFSDTKQKTNEKIPINITTKDNLNSQPQQGRPKNSKDTEPRKTKEFSPQTGASINLWAIKAQDKISEIINPLLLEFYNKKNVRSLSSSEYDELDNLKTKILFTLSPFSEIVEDKIISKLDLINNKDTNSLFAKYKIWSKETNPNIDKGLTIEEHKQNRAYFLSMVYKS
jgi:hypothetical protein